MTSASSQDLDWLRPGGDAAAVIRGMAARMRELSGQGEAADGAVVITVDNTGTVSEVRLDPAVSRFGPAELGAHVLAAARAAAADLQGRMQALMRESLGAEPTEVDPGEVGRRAVANARDLAAGLTETLARTEAEARGVRS